MSKSNFTNDSTVSKESRKSLIKFLAGELSIFNNWAQSMAYSVHGEEDFNDFLASEAEVRLRKAETTWNDYYENVKCMHLYHDQPGWQIDTTIHKNFFQGSAVIISYLKRVKQPKEMSFKEWNKQKILYFNGCNNF
ncbi:hypothetical protein TKK_0002421 [Trichogramma kaykai]